MTRQLKLQALQAILRLTPASKSMLRFDKYVERGDLEGFWTYYQGAMGGRSDIRRNVEEGGQISFEMLEPAMRAVYQLQETPE